MKGDLKTTRLEGFEPFTVEFTIETIEDARLLYHICNHGKIGQLILDDPEYHITPYVQEFTQNLGETRMYDKIFKEVEEQGYRI